MEISFLLFVICYFPTKICKLNFFIVTYFRTRRATFRNIPKLSLDFVTVWCNLENANNKILENN